MKKSIFYLGLLFMCLPPCAAQARHGLLRHTALHRTTSVVKTARPASASLKPATMRPAAGGPFSDVPKDHWAAAAVETLRQRGIVVGYPAGE